MSQWSAGNADQSAEHIVTVSQITDQIKHLLEGVFDNVWVCGEISNLTLPQSGHAYFTLKDQHSQLRAVIWRSAKQQLKFDIQNGMEIVCFGNIDVYGPRGTYQLSVQSAEPKGVGALQLAFRQLHDRLQAKGYFDPAHKQPLPKYPKRIAIVTSPSGAAIRDFLQVLNRRWSNVELLVIPARVQGDGSAAEIARGIRAANRLVDPPDVLVVGRGGGSAEDLWSFNEEIVIEAIYQSQIPVVSSVGHEIDVTLSDLAADLRALTPSEAAERVVPSMDEVMAQLNQFPQRLQAALQKQVVSARNQLNSLARSRVLTDPLDLIHNQQRRLDESQLRMHNLMQLSLEKKRSRIERLSGKLESISPLSVLGRGYSITSLRDGDQPLHGSAELREGDELKTRLNKGTIISQFVRRLPNK